MGVSKEDISGSLRERIASGEWEPGDKLPSSRALASEYGAARGTAADAIHLLAQDGLVELKNKSAAVVLAPSDGGQTPEARLTDALEELVALQDDAKELERLAHDVAERLAAVLSKVERSVRLASRRQN